MSQLPHLTDARLELENRVATLTFQRDDVRNALTGTALTEDIVKTVAWANLEREVSALIITGDGKAFSSGGNVKDMREKQGMFAGQAAEIQEQYRQGIQRIPMAMYEIEVPTIAAVNGAAIGAGFDLANMCDIRLGCPETAPVAIIKGYDDVFVRKPTFRPASIQFRKSIDNITLVS